MGNPLMGMMGRAGMPQMNPMKMMQEFKKFCRDMQGVNPDEKMKELVQSGKITQEQADQAMDMARQMQSMFNN